MYFTPQQLSGGPKYTHKTRMGNWNEDWTAHDYQVKEYMAKKDKDALAITRTERKYAKSGNVVPHTYREDGTLEYDDYVLLKSCQTDGTLVCNMADRVGSVDEAYMVNTRVGTVGPIARSVYIIQRAKGNNLDDKKVRYGDEVRIKSNPFIADKDLFLHSCPISPLAYARFSRNQEVSLHSQPNFNTVWRILATPGNGYYNETVKAGVPIVLEHCATSQNLSTDKIPYRNDFGNEYEVSAKSNATLRKTQMCGKERTGEMVREGTAKDIGFQNHWKFELSAEPSNTPEEASKVKYSGVKMVEDMREAFRSVNLLSIQDLMKVFKAMDADQSNCIHPDELQKGLERF